MIKIQKINKKMKQRKINKNQKFLKLRIITLNNNPKCHKYQKKSKNNKKERIKNKERKERNKKERKTMFKNLKMIIISRIYNRRILTILNNKLKIQFPNHQKYQNNN